MHTFFNSFSLAFGWTPRTSYSVASDIFPSAVVIINDFRSSALSVDYVREKYIQTQTDSHKHFWAYFPAEF